MGKHRRRRGREASETSGPTQQKYEYDRRK